MDTRQMSHLPGCADLLVRAISSLCTMEANHVVWNGHMANGPAVAIRIGVEAEPIWLDVRQWVYDEEALNIPAPGHYRQGPTVVLPKARGVEAVCDRADWHRCLNPKHLHNRASGLDRSPEAPGPRMEIVDPEFWAAGAQVLDLTAVARTAVLLNGEARLPRTDELRKGLQCFHSRLEESVTITSVRTHKLRGSKFLDDQVLVQRPNRQIRAALVADLWIPIKEK